MHAGGNRRGKLLRECRVGGGVKIQAHGLPVRARDGYSRHVLVPCADADAGSARCETTIVSIANAS